MNKSEEKRFIRRAIIISGAVAVALSLIILLLYANRHELTLLRASSLISQGNADGALELLDKLDGGDDAVQAQLYRAALALESQGREDEALALYEELSGFANAKDRVNGIGYLRAEALLSEGDIEAAAQAFFLLGDYSDAGSRYDECIRLMQPEPTATPTQAPTAAPTQATTAAPTAQSTQAPTAAPTPTPASEPTPAPTTQLEGLRAGRERVVRYALALGSRHTVGLRSDGTVVAAGDNADGQCGVSGWTGVTQVAAGARHTLGLRADGTVYGAGDNTYGQLEVAEWRGVKQIAAGAYDSFALLEDGTVLSTGYHTYPDIAQWHSIKRIAAGSYGLVALYDGGCLGTFPSMMLKGYFADAAVSTGYAVGLKEDGSVELSNGPALDWRGIVSLSAGANAVMALDISGDVWLRFFREGLSELPSPDGEVVAVEAGDTHYAMLLSDGRVVCFGDNERGQCDTGAWSLGTRGN